MCFTFKLPIDILKTKQNKNNYENNGFGSFCKILFMAVEGF